MLSLIRRWANLVEVTVQLEWSDRFRSEPQLLGRGKPSPKLLLASWERERPGRQRPDIELHPHQDHCGGLPLHSDRVWGEGGCVFEGVRQPGVLPLPHSSWHRGRGGWDGNMSCSQHCILSSRYIFASTLILLFGPFSPVSSCIPSCCLPWSAECLRKRPLKDRYKF